MKIRGLECPASFGNRRFAGRMALILLTVKNEDEERPSPRAADGRSSSVIGVIGEGCSAVANLS